ncbi:MAG: L-arabinose isomerase [Halanaerobiaceae bacterium]
MINLDNYEVWFITGSQHLYGEEVLKKVENDSRKIVEGLSRNQEIPVEIVHKPVVTTSDGIRRVFQEANSSEKCAGIITWMHTFSPAKMWISGLKTLQKPFVHLHTQFNEKLPWSEIDMDFMNLNQSAHGGREYGHIVSRLRLNRKVIVGHWQEKEVVEKLAVWVRAACAWQDSQNLKIARFGDNMRKVAVTEGDKVEAQIKFGYSVDGYGLGDLQEFANAIKSSEMKELMAEYENRYNVDKSLLAGGKNRDSLKESARIELALRSFLEEGGFKGFTTTFENLQGLKQLPGLAVQRLMADGYGFGAEGDWKTAALVRSMKVMSAGLEGGTSFMEDYTYHLDPEDPKVLGAHMLEVCESISEDKPSLEIHPLSIGGKAAPVRLVFNSKTGPGLNASIIDMGNRFRLIVNEVEAIKPDKSLPRLPVARVVWKPKPNLKSAAASWILAGGAHHAGFSLSITTEHLRDFAEMADIEMVVIDENTKVEELKKELRWNEVYYRNN